jgi:DNA-binding MarR family transcriptional regulator
VWDAIASAYGDPGTAVNLRQLHYLLAIADQGSFTRAAEQLLVAQPSLSQQIKSLEQELGGPLLERLPKSVRLTAAGKAFLPEARAAVAHAERARRDARSALGLHAGELEVATVTSVAFGLLRSAHGHPNGQAPPSNSAGRSSSPSSPRSTRLAAAFLEVLQAQAWKARPPSATDLG